MRIDTDYSEEEITAMLDAPLSMHVKFYLPRLSDGEVAKLERWASKIMDRASAVGAWLHGYAIREAWRRKAAREYEFVTEAEALAFPVRLDNKAIAAGLGAVAAATYAVDSYLLGQLFDRLFWILTAIAQERLRKQGLNDDDGNETEN